MGLIARIKQLFSKQTNIETTNIVSYDTSFTYIPQYKELADDEKKIVNKYIEETDLTKLENIIFYGNEVCQNANSNTELLLDVLYKMTEEQTEWELSLMSEEEILEERLNEMIRQEELELYKTALKELEKESTLRTVALEEIRKSQKKFLNRFGIFGKAERIQRKNEEKQLETAIERMKINKKMIEQQIQSITNTILDSGTITRAVDIYNVMLQDKNVEDKKQKVIEEKKKEIFEMANLVLPGGDKLQETKEENVQVKQLAKIQRKLEIYAYTHKKDIVELRKEIEEIEKIEKTSKNKERLLKEITDIQTKYKIFGRYIQDEDLEQLYKVKFDILMIDINKRKESPLKDITNKKELKYYERIVERKIEDIIQGTNPQLKKSFGEKQLRDAVRIINKILKDAQRTFQIEKILQDKVLLSLILAFDKEKGLESVSLNKEDVDVELYEDICEWEDQIPLQSIFELRKLEDRPVTDTDNVYIKLYNMYEDNRQKNSDVNEIGDYKYVCKYKLPEGITRLKSHDRFMKGNNILANKLESCDKIILPSTLKVIEKNAFSYHIFLCYVAFNEGLEIIDESAFYECSNLGKYRRIELPSTLKTIGKKAFCNCCMLEIKLNEGLMEIGDKAFYSDNFWYFNRSSYHKTLCLPSSVKSVGKDIVNSQVITIVKKERKLERE